MAFDSRVRLRISRSRKPTIIRAACCSAVFTGTKRIVGRLIASQSPSASARGVLRGEEDELFGKKSGARIGLEKAAQVPHGKSCFFLGLLCDPVFGVLPVEPARADFDQAFPSLI